MGNSNLLFESIFKRKLSDADTREYLTQLMNEYPWFSPAQFFLLLQTEKGTADYRELLAKTSVLFNNPYWLQFQLQEKQQNHGEIAETFIADDNKFVPEEGQEIISTQTKEPNETFGNNETTKTNQSQNEIIEAGNSVQTKHEMLSAQSHETANDISEGKEFPIIGETLLLLQDGTTGADISEQPTEPLIPGNIISAQEKNVDGSIAEKEIEPVPDEHPILSQPEKEEVIIDTFQSGHFNNENSPLVNESETENDPFEEQEIEPLHFKLNIDTPNTTIEDNITFEPLYTSDYFASLGIKLSSEIKPSDKLGQQLKSFTEWLKTMKKIHTDQLPALSGQSDIYIQKLAEESNKDDAVVTEAMADVLLRQGKADKALEVYIKLSLLNPSKSAYFAAKIDQLKEH